MILTLRRRGFWLGLVALAAAGPSVLGLAKPAGAAAVQPPSPLSPADAALAAEAERYLDGLTAAEGRFVQTAGPGRQAAGAFWLQRPGLARFDYDPPSGLSVASDGHLVSEVNHQLKTIQSLPLGATPLNLLLARKLRLDGKVEVRQVLATDKAFSLELVERRAGAGGKIVLQFSRDPVALTGWALTDGRGQTVHVQLTKLIRAAPRPKSFFNIYDPSLHGQRPQDATPLS